MSRSLFISSLVVAGLAATAVPFAIVQTVQRSLRYDAAAIVSTADVLDELFDHGALG